LPWAYFCFFSFFFPNDEHLIIYAHHHLHGPSSSFPLGMYQPYLIHTLSIKVGTRFYQLSKTKLGLSTPSSVPLFGEGMAGMNAREDFATSPSAWLREKRCLPLNLFSEGIAEINTQKGFSTGPSVWLREKRCLPLNLFGEGMAKINAREGFATSPSTWLIKKWHHPQTFLARDDETWVIGFLCQPLGAT
jgi:hypothetical protein